MERRRSPSGRGAVLLDRWLQQQHLTRIVPQYRQLARACRKALHEGGLPALERVWRERLPHVQNTLTDVITLSLHVATSLSTLAFGHELLKKYGARTTRSLLMAVAAPSLEEVQKVIEGILPAWPESIQDIPVGTGAPKKVLESYLNYRDQYGMNFSERIWKNDATTRAELHKAILQHLSSGEGVLHDVEGLKSFLADDPTLPKYLQDLERSARAALQNAPDAKKAFKIELEKARDQLDKLTGGPLGTRGYTRTTISRLAKAVKEGNAEVVDQSVNYYIDKRGSYRASVLLRSEGIRAYQLATWETYKQHHFVLAVKWNLSPTSHKVPDE